ncbi:hypothetical protein LO763_22770 [Glycomyces sp. A-F 0318]|uniref:hypothetical protein n=1 Tax=Glycomyces amatae TaxID=2881355 RepID=UPI001E634CB9|nr:hypothetical protein [Glycomyces amatae]MCD0446443.1 hypothetical protein [Glycomyces amatae]
MTDLRFIALDDAVAARDRDWPDAEPLLGLSAWLGSDVRCDRATGTLVILNDMSDPQDTRSVAEPHVYLNAFPAREWTGDADFTDLMSDRASDWGTDPTEIATLQTALNELANSYAASLHADRPSSGTREAVASALASQEHDLRAQLALTRMLRAHVVRDLVTDAPPTADMERVDVALQYPVDSFEELVALVNDHRRLMGEVI